MAEGNPRARTWLPLAIALALFAALAAHFDFLVDDAFISFRYGRHLSQGHGLVWNIGEQPPVEGFSNFLWVAYAAVLDWLGLDPAVWSRVASIACGAALIALVARLVRSRVSSEFDVVLPSAAFIATLPPIALWATGGLETMPFALAVFGTFEQLVRDRARPSGLEAGVCAALACLLRADGFVWVAIALAAAFVVAIREHDKPLARDATTVIAVAAATSLAYVAFRWSYFHELEPNTARAKVHVAWLTLARGACYVASLLLCVVSIPLAIACGASRAKRETSGLALPSLIAVLAGFAYLILVGGDWMMMYRMLVPTLPFVAVLFAVWLASLRSAQMRYVFGVACVVLSILPAFDVHVVPRRIRELAHFRWSQEFRSEYAVWDKGVVDIGDWIELGKAVARETRPGESIVLGNIGAIGYYASELVLYDTQGLTNKKPLTAVDPQHAMAGHDRLVTMDAFDVDRPTYFATALVDADAPLAGLPAKWRDPNSDAAQKYEFIVRPLAVHEGAPPDKALLLVKYRR